MKRLLSILLLLPASCFAASGISGGTTGGGGISGAGGGGTGSTITNLSTNVAAMIHLDGQASIAYTNNVFTSLTNYSTSTSNSATMVANFNGGSITVPTAGWYAVDGSCAFVSSLPGETNKMLFFSILKNGTEVADTRMSRFIRYSIQEDYFNEVSGLISCAANDVITLGVQGSNAFGTISHTYTTLRVTSLAGGGSGGSADTNGLASLDAVAASNAVAVAAAVTASNTVIVRFTNNLAVVDPVNGVDTYAGRSVVDPIKTFYNVSNLFFSNYTVVLLPGTHVVTNKNANGSAGNPPSAYHFGPNTIVQADGASLSVTNIRTTTFGQQSGVHTLGNFEINGGTIYAYWPSNIMASLRPSGLPDQTTRLTLNRLKILSSSDGIYFVTHTNRVDVVGRNCEFDSQWDAINYSPQLAATNGVWEFYGTKFYAHWDDPVLNTNLYSLGVRGYYADGGGTSYLVGCKLEARNGRSETYGVMCVNGAKVYLNGTTIEASSTNGGAVAKIYISGAGSVVTVPFGAYDTNSIIVTNGGTLAYYSLDGSSLTNLSGAQIGHAFIPDQTNALACFGAGTAAINRNYFWSVVDQKYTNTGTRCIVFTNGYWALGVSGIPSYTNTTLFGPWSIGPSAGASPAPTVLPLMYASQMAQTNAATDGQVAVWNNSGEVSWTNALNVVSATATNLNAASATVTSNMNLTGSGTFSGTNTFSGGAGAIIITNGQQLIGNVSLTNSSAGSLLLGVTGGGNIRLGVGTSGGSFVLADKITMNYGAGDITLERSGSATALLSSHLRVASTITASNGFIAAPSWQTLSRTWAGLTNSINLLTNRYTLTATTNFGIDSVSGVPLVGTNTVSILTVTASGADRTCLITNIAGQAWASVTVTNNTTAYFMVDCTGGSDTNVSWRFK